MKKRLEDNQNPFENLLYILLRSTHNACSFRSNGEANDKVKGTKGEKQKEPLSTVRT